MPYFQYLGGSFWGQFEDQLRAGDHFGVSVKKLRIISASGSFQSQFGNQFRGTYQFPGDLHISQPSTLFILTLFMFTFMTLSNDVSLTNRFHVAVRLFSNRSQIDL